MYLADPHILEEPLISYHTFMNNSHLFFGERCFYMANSLYGALILKQNQLVKQKGNGKRNLSNKNINYQFFLDFCFDLWSRKTSTNIKNWLAFNTYDLDKNGSVMC